MDAKYATKVLEKKDGTLSYEVEIDPQIFEESVQDAYLKNRSRILIPGFRKGKAPRKLVEGMYGADFFYPDAVEDLAYHAYEIARRKIEERIVGDPAIADYHVDDKKALVIRFESSLYPEVKVGQYKGLSAYRAPVEVSEEQVERELKLVQDRNARIQTVERPAALGDTVVIDFDGFVNGKRFDGGKAKDYELTLGSGSFVPGFEDQLVGAAAGESREVNVTFPTEYVAELAGKQALFKVKVHEVREKILPALDDEFAKDVSEFDTLKEYKASVKAELTAAAEKRSDDAFHKELIRKAMEGLEVAIPASMLRVRTERMERNYRNDIEEQGFSLNEYLGMLGMDYRTFRGFLQMSAEETLRREMLLEEIARLEGFEVTDEMVEKEYASIAEQEAMDVEDMKEDLEREDVELILRSRMAEDLVYSTGVALDKPEEPEQDETPAAEETPAEEGKE